jgi:hypothetical protein
MNVPLIFLHLYVYPFASGVLLIIAMWQWYVLCTYKHTRKGLEHRLYAGVGFTAAWFLVTVLSFNTLTNYMEYMK